MGLLASMPWRLDLATNHLKRGAFGGPSSQAFKGQFTRLFSVFSHPAMKSLQRLAVDCDHTIDSILTTSEEEDMAVWQALGKPFPPLRLPFLPKLRKAVFAALPREFFSLRAWNLTHLHIGGPNMDVKTWSRIMHVCARLVKGCFVLMKNEDDADGQLSSGEPIPIPPIVVQKELKELTLLIEIELEPRGTTFHWPALTKFAMYYGLTHSTFWMPALMDEFGLGQGRSPLLSHLTLIGDDGHDGASLVLLQALPTLEELCITVSDEAEEIISWLSLRTDQTLSLPHLRALGLRLVEGNEDFDPADSDDDDDEAEESHGSTLWRARMVPFVTRLIEERARHEDSGGGAPSLENLVLKISGTCQATVRYFKNRLTPVSWFGVKISVEELDYHSGFWAYKPDHGCNLNHWDEGFQDFMEANELCELYPTEGFLHKALTDDAAELRE
ncbi:hypothetical protein BKA70DRAFT_1331240 [Coprinopsis sp. MPI-PUGE-AT-0042]|nr:hypothetical protein BKA70DRAFT_1331240 [Coprinopsis sp. MPI-PUGE-AT-0042]